MKLQKIAFSTLFLTCILAMLVVPLFHSFENDHDDETCELNHLEHFCNHDFEQQQLYFNINLDINKTVNYQFINKRPINSVDVLQENFLTNYQNLSFSLRAPPYQKFI
jgi:hypothetical protein